MLGLLLVSFLNNNLMVGVLFYQGTLFYNDEYTWPLGYFKVCISLECVIIKKEKRCY